MANVHDLGKVIKNFTESVLYEGDTRNIELNTNINLKESINNYDYILVDYFSSQTKQQFLKVSELNSTIITTLFNMKDSEPYNFYMWEHGIKFTDSNKNVFTINIRNCIKLDPTDNTLKTYPDDKDTGIRKIIGFKYQ